MRPLRVLPAFAAILMLTVELAARQPAKDAAAVPERYTALAANISNVGAAGIIPLDIQISRWTTPDEQARLFDALRSKGQDEFLKELLRVKPVGWVATPTSLRYEFYFATQTATPRGRRIMMITDRPMQVSERVAAAPSREYPFTVLDMTLDTDGRGEGTLSQLVQLRMSGDILGIDNLASAPIKLNDIKKQS